MEKSQEIEVWKSNELIQKSRHNLSELEQKTLNYICTLINPKEELDKLEYQFEIVDMIKTMGITNQGSAYDDIKAALKKLRDTSWWHTLPDGSETTVGWLMKANTNKRSGTAKIMLDPDLKPYLVGLREKFTKFELYNTLALKGKYSIRLYEILRSQVKQGFRVYSVEEIYKLLGYNPEAPYGKLKEKALNKAKEQINKFTDISIDFKDNGARGRKATKICFVINYKDATQRLDAYLAADKELNSGIIDTERFSDDFKDFILNSRIINVQQKKETEKRNKSKVRGREEPIPDYDMNNEKASAEDVKAALLARDRLKDKDVEEVDFYQPSIFDDDAEQSISALDNADQNKLPF